MQDICFSVKQTKTNTTFIALYVDNLLTAGKSIKSILTIKDQFSKLFKVENCGEAKLCLGRGTSRNRLNSVLKICQLSYAEKLLLRFNM